MLDQPPHIAARGADFDQPVGHLHGAAFLIDNHGKAGALDDRGQHWCFDRKMRHARVANLVEHRPDLLDQLRDTGALLVFRKDQPAARCDDHIIAAAGQHRTTIRASRQHIPRGKRGSNLHRCRLHSASEKLHLSGFLGDDPHRGFAAFRHRR